MQTETNNNDENEKQIIELQKQILEQAKKTTGATEDITNTIRTIRDIGILACIADGNLLNIMECL
jgi:hypothetical protein